MSGPEFHRTVMGQRFYNIPLPELIKQLTRIAGALERLAPPSDDEETSQLTEADLIKTGPERE